jgi:hypothetical protein
MPEQIALIEAPLYDVTGERGPAVLEQIAAFELLGTTVRASLTCEGDTLHLSIGKRRFALSLIDLAATAAIAAEGHLKQQIVAKIVESRQTPDPDEAISAHHFGDARRRH